jgi:hypothetical protein
MEHQGRRGREILYAAGLLCIYIGLWWFGRPSQIALILMAVPLCAAWLAAFGYRIGRSLFVTTATWLVMFAALCAILGGIVLLLTVGAAWSLTFMTGWGLVVTAAIGLYHALGLRLFYEAPRQEEEPIRGFPVGLRKDGREGESTTGR